MKPGKLTVVGIGYVGLPLAVLASEKKWQVTGLDINEEKVKAVNARQVPFQDEALARQLKKHPIQATTDPSVAAQSDVIVVAVPTPVTHRHAPDLKPLQGAITNLLPHLQNGQILIIESTINPGVMDEVVVPLLRQRKDLKLELDGSSKDALILAHCPERINPGDDKWNVRNIPRVIGGYSQDGVKAARDFYASILEADITIMASVTEAEAVKILENTFRDINIAYVNEMAKSFTKLGIDITNVIKGASTKPFAFLAHYPGNGVGGHCISVDPYYMIERGRQVGFDHEFLKLARQINDSMPAHAVELMREGIKTAGITKKPTVALLGLAYKKNIGDLRESPAATILGLLKKAKFPVKVYDPFAPKQSTVASLDEALKDSPVVMLATDHDEFIKQLTPKKLKQAAVKIIIDGKNSLAGKAFSAAGIYYYGIGRRSLP